MDGAKPNRRRRYPRTEVNTAMNTKPTGPVSRRLAELVEAQLKQRGWSTNRAATEAGLPHDAFPIAPQGAQAEHRSRARSLQGPGWVSSMAIGMEPPANDPRRGTERGTVDVGTTRTRRRA